MYKALTALAAATAIGASAIPALGSDASSTAIRHDPVHKVTNSKSTNWSGYAATGRTFTSVSAPTASVTTDAVGRFTLTISDTSQPWTFTTTQRVKSAALASAEAPSSRSGVLPLTNFGTVNFTGATANGASLSSFNPDRIDMVSGTTVKAQTSSISSNGSFSVTWKHS